MRLQLALNVDDLETAIDHYSKMFSAAPHKVRDGYANFAIDDPALKLVLFENPDAVQHLNHIGVEMFGADAIKKTSQRFAKAGILKDVQRDTVCCHTGQDKVWTENESDLSWEWYVINDDQPPVPADYKAAQCCGTGADAGGGDRRSRLGRRRRRGGGGSGALPGADDRSPAGRPTPRP